MAPRRPPSRGRSSGAAITRIEDDVPAALARADAEGKLLFIDAWAPWCHTCLAMQDSVLSDPAVVRLADRFVFARSTPIARRTPPSSGRYAIHVWPTLFVIAPPAPPGSRTPTAARRCWSARARACATSPATLAARIALLDDAARRATTPEGRAALDYMRMRTYEEAGRFADAIAMLEYPRAARSLRAARAARERARQGRPGARRGRLRARHWQSVRRPRAAPP